MLLCARYVIPVTSEPIEDGAVLVRDGRIVDMGQASMMRLRYPQEETTDFGTAAITPGFIDLYSCSEDAVLRGLIPDVPYVEWLRRVWELRQQLTKDDVYYSAYLGGLEALSSGITTMADITKTGACVRVAQELGMRGTFYREVIAVDKKLVNYSIKKAASDIEGWSQKVDGSRIKLGFAPGQVFRVHPSVYTEVAKFATEHGNLPVALRLAGSAEEFRFVKYGAPFTGPIEDDKRVDLEGYMEVAPWLPTSVTPVNYVLNWGGFETKNILAIHCTRVNEDDLEKLKAHDVAVAVCPSINAQLGMGAAPIMEFLRSGMRIGISTNAPAALDFLDMFAEMRVALLIQRAMTAGTQDFLTSQTLMEMGTIRAAQALHIEDEVGSLEVGKKADIVAIDLSSSANHFPTLDPITAVLGSAARSDIMMTMVDGNVLYDQRGWLTGQDTSEKVAHVLATRKRIRG